MKNIIGKGNNRKFYFTFSWGYYYFSAGYLFCKNKIFSLCDELYDYRMFPKKFVPVG